MLYRWMDAVVEFFTRRQPEGDNVGVPECPAKAAREACASGAGVWAANG